MTYRELWAAIRGEAEWMLLHQTVAKNYRDYLRAFRWELIEHYLACHGGNITETARALGMTRSFLSRIVNRRRWQEGRVQWRAD